MIGLVSDSQLTLILLNAVNSNPGPLHYTLAGVVLIVGALMLIFWDRGPDE